MKKLNIVLPDGSMQETVMELLSKAGLDIRMGKKRSKEGRINVPWIDRVVFQRPQEIPGFLQKGCFDLAIVGEDWIDNCGCNFPTLLKLPIGRSGSNAVRIVLAVSTDSGFKNIQDLPKGCEVATEYVQLTRKFFITQGRRDIKVTYSHGNTEQKIAFGASAIVDVTESGQSLKDNNLVIISELMRSNTVLVANQDSYANKSKRPYVECFESLVRGAYQASRYVMITANVPTSKNIPSKAGRIMEGLKGPSQSPLRIKGWVALQSIVPRENEQRVIFELLQIGVTDIIVSRNIPLIMT